MTRSHQSSLAESGAGGEGNLRVVAGSGNAASVMKDAIVPSGSPT